MRLQTSRHESRNNLLSSFSCPELSVRKSWMSIVSKAGPVFQFCFKVFALLHSLVLVQNIFYRLDSFQKTTENQTKSITQNFFQHSLLIRTVYIRIFNKFKETLEREFEYRLSVFQILLGPCKRENFQ